MNTIIFSAVHSLNKHLFASHNISVSLFIFIVQLQNLLYHLFSTETEFSYAESALVMLVMKDIPS